MAERSFVSEIEDLRKGEGDVFTGEGILAITKALLECGVGYVGGYQGAPISHLMDVLADAEELMSELGVRFEANASEAAAAAMLAASVHYPIRGAVTFKGPVGVNVASDALANLCSSGVNGGALIIVGEDYGEGSSIMQERSHGFAMFLTGFSRCHPMVLLYDCLGRLKPKLGYRSIGFDLRQKFYGAMSGTRDQRV